MHYPMRDLSVPNDKKGFRNFVFKEIVSSLKHESVLVHCFGGHGRSGVAIGCALAKMTLLKNAD